MKRGGWRMDDSTVETIKHLWEKTESLDKRLRLLTQLVKVLNEKVKRLEKA